MPTFSTCCESQYEELNNIVDAVAERGRTVGGQAVATLAEFAKLTRLKEHPGEYFQIGGMIGNLLTDHEMVIRHLRSDVDICADKYHDLGTSDLLTGLMERHEKMAWMLRAMLDGGSK